MSKNKIYAVKKGLVPGLYKTWDECEKQVKGFPRAEYKSFASEEEARAYLEGDEVLNAVPEPADDAAKALVAAKFLFSNNYLSFAEYERILERINTTNNPGKDAVSKAEPAYIDIYVDGSYNSETGDYGYGIFMDDGTNKKILYGRGKCQEGGRNVEGEVAASLRAIEEICQMSKDPGIPQYKSIIIYHDYEGIGKWADNIWKANKDYTKAYAAFVAGVRDRGYNIRFRHVTGHTGVQENEIVDKLAKIGCGIELSLSEKAFLSEYRNVLGYPDTYEMPAPDQA